LKNNTNYENIENDCLINSFDLINLFGSLDSKKIRRFFNLQSLHFDKNENSIYFIIKPCIQFFKIDGNKLLLNEYNIIDWKSKKKIDNINNEFYYPSYLFSIIKFQKISENNTLFETFLCKF
jgi:hypothetical protein